MTSIALSFLVFVYNFIGVSDLPAEVNHDWRVVERWAVQNDGSYRLVLLSNTIQRLCGTGGYIVFSQAYTGMSEIYADKNLIYTNSTAQRWHLASTLGRPVLSCEYFKNANSIEMHMYSKSKYFASIYKYPFFSKKYPISQFMYEQVYFLSGMFLFFMGIIGAYIFSKFLSYTQGFIFFMYNFGFSLLMYAHMPGFISDIDVSVSHSLIFISLNCALLYFSLFSLSDHFQKQFLSKLNILFFTFVAMFLYVSHGSAVVTQALIVLFIPFAILTSFLLFLYKYLKGTRTEAILHFLLFVVVTKDCYMSQLTRDGFLYLSFLLIITAVLGFLKLLDQVNKKRRDLDFMVGKLESESKILSKISSINDMHREIIHDLKSPLMALDFNLKSSEQSQIVNSAISRLRSILSRMSDGEVKKNFDWYSVQALEDIVKKISVENGVKHIHKNFSPIKNIEIYFDPLDIEVCMSELFDNAVKYSSLKRDIKVIIDEEDAYILLKVLNPVLDRVVAGSLLLRKGVSEQSSGLGLVSVRSKTEAMGGLLTVRAKSGIFEAVLKLRKR